MRAWAYTGLLGLAVALGAAPSAATPVTYLFSSGAVTFSAESGGVPVATAVNALLEGVSVTVDESALTVSLTFDVGTTGSVPVSYGTFTTFNLLGASVTGTGGTLTLNDPGPNPKEYGFDITVNVSGNFDASPPTLTNQPFSVTGASGDGLIFIDGNELTLSQLSIGGVDPDGPGGLEPLVIKGDFIFVGIVPEPGTVLLLGAGLVGVAAARRREGAR